MEERRLFGGAVLASLPASFTVRALPGRPPARRAGRLTQRTQDVSAMRDVPDSQELWVDEASDVSLIVEFVEHLPLVAVRPCARTWQPGLHDVSLTRSRCAAQDDGSARFFWSDVASLNDCPQAVCAPARASSADADEQLTRLFEAHRRRTRWRR